MPLFDDDDLVVCHRAAYSRITPQACMERHLRSPQACGSCQYNVYCLHVMVSATGLGAEQLVKITSEGQINKYANPLVNTAAKADWEKDQIVNSRIVFINGIRARQGFVKEFRRAGGMADRFLVLVLAAEDVEKIKGGVREIAVDELIAGRIVYRFEWNADSPADKMSEAADSKDKKKMVSFRLSPVALDSFTQ